MSDNDHDRDLREELEYHLARRAEFDQSSPEDARRRFGNPTRIQEEMRAMRIPVWLDGLRQDLAYAIRTFARTPGFTIASVVALALGIGSVTAVFSVVDPLLFRPLPYADEHRLVSIGMGAPIESNDWLLGPDYIEWREHQTAFESMTAMRGGQDCALTEGNPTNLKCFVAESNFLATFGAQPALGRTFTSEEDQPNGVPVALISYALWQSRFGGSEQVLGRTLELEGKRREIIGVLPASFETPGMNSVDLLIPMRLDVVKERSRKAMMTYLRVFGRLRPGVTVDQARESLKPLFQDSMKILPPHFRGEIQLRVTGFREHQVQEYRTASLILFAAVLGVLLVACANVANLMLARGAAREREMAVRAAIGASRRRLLRQTLTENWFLSGAAGAAGIALAYALLAIFRSLAPGGIPRLGRATLDVRVLIFAIALSLLAGTLAGLAPAMRLPSGEMLTGTRATGSRKDWLRQILAAAQIAISLVLLVGSGLLIRSLWRIQQIDLGIETSRVLVAELRPGRGHKQTPDSLRAFFLDAEQRLRQVPGVESVALSDTMPPGSAMQVVFSRIEKEGKPASPARANGGMVARQLVTETYFQTLHVPIIRGRGFLEEDRKSASDIAIVDGALARRLFPGEDVLGKRIRPTDDSAWATIVGVSRNVRNMGLFDASDPAIYILQRDSGEWTSSLLALIRTQRDERAVTPLIRSEIQRLEPKSPVKIVALGGEVRELSASQRFNATLLGLFSFFALALAAIGLAGVVSYLVTQRTQELGVRMALGASPGKIRALVLGQSMSWILAGAIVGLLTGLIAMRSLKSLLYQVEPNDPLIIGGVTLTLLVVGMLSAWLPARRAAKLDPMVALRHD